MERIIINVNIRIFCETAQILDLSGCGLGKPYLDLYDRLWINSKPSFRINHFGGIRSNFFEKLEIWIGQHGDSGDEHSIYFSDGKVRSGEILNAAIVALK